MFRTDKYILNRLKANGALSYLRLLSECPEKINPEDFSKTIEILEKEKRIELEGDLFKLVGEKS